MKSLITQTTFHGLPAIQVRTADGAEATVSLFGGQVLHWQPAGGRPWLYLSEQSAFDGKHAIRGGVPVCFPQFAAQGDLPRHGLVRTRPWRLIDQREVDKQVMLTLGIDSDDDTLALWPHLFALELTINIGGARLDMELEITNTGPDAFGFSAALHTYLRVGEVEMAELHGLKGLRYADACDGGTIKTDPMDMLRVDDPVDRIYADARRPLLLDDSGRHLQIEKENFPDVVVWNPWEAGAAALADLPDRDFRRMLCVEAAATAPIMLAADAQWWGRQSLIVGD
ncbi:D-hexose-6-phosphate mutarotase [Denitromonas iodatirespirans]|uniref:Putative glucose-6-phosphate 1-epimerase n=1 Tax=Denitromonas iodatirespirans TaxID=2795389 RepID=A0A944D7U0_DENI1|nr:D-hexose-6-phosphate mutarotase [Denitromonas iodatirespirans]MBT0961415.1 D-hexose-6-phosphate mutarotase [Denitromonas iodatirespirans]